MESHLLGDGRRAQSTGMEFVDAIESGLITSDTIFIRRIVDQNGFEKSEYKCSRYWEVLNSNHVRIFCFGKLGNGRHKECQEILILIISNTCGSQILNIKKRPRTPPLIGSTVYELSGSGLLQFEEVRTLCGYTLRDKWKQLCKIQIPICLQLFPCFGYPKTIPLANLDGTRAGSFKYLTSSSGSSEFSIEFERGTDRKAKYVLFCSSILPFFQYFDRP